MKLLLDLDLPEYKNEPYIYFWGHQGKHPKTCLSQWYPSPFIVDGYKYATAEHWMMAQKALLFNDPGTFNKIIQSVDPREVKAMGRKIKGFDSAIWDDEKYYIIVEGNVEKFKQNPSLKDYLLSTNNAICVESSPYDKIYGIGLTEHDARGLSHHQWKGENLLGFALMEVRTILRDMDTIE